MPVRLKLLWSALLVLTAGGLVTVIALTAQQEQPSGVGAWLLFAWALALLVIVLVLTGWEDPHADAEDS
jgi:heme/copper-type cytochrome/quinol oxidase subunit 3